jgi:5-methylcytosine-specific restriction endonuclease McrA
MAKHPEIYQDPQWKPARKECIRRAKGLCERCKKKDKVKKGKISHHKIWLTDENKTDWNIAFNPDNLEYLCNDCHEEEHDRSIGLQKFLTPPGVQI